MHPERCNPHHVRQFLTITADVTFSSSFIAGGTKVVYGGVQANGGNSDWQPLTTIFGPAGSGIAGPSVLHTNLGAIPFDKYDDTHQTAEFAGLAGTCPGVNTIRACYRSIFDRFRAQGVTGVRFYVGFCGGDSTPLNNCGSGIQANTFWPTGVHDFFSDLYEKQIYDITPRLVHGDFAGIRQGGIGVQFQPKNQLSSPSGTLCTTTPDVVQFTPTEPWGTVPCTNTPPYYCPLSVQDCSQYCTNASPGFPIDDNVTGYNCSPANPIFVGWQALDSVANMLIQKAATPSAHLNIFEFEVEQELNVTSFPVMARLIYDNAHTQTGNRDSLGEIRSYMSSNGYDPLRVTVSASDSRVDQANFNCTDVYAGYARLILLDSVASAIGGGVIGYPPGSTASHLLTCGGGPPDLMFQMPFGHTLPNIWDFHTYPCVVNPSSGGCYTDSQANVQGEAQTVFSDFTNFLARLGPLSSVFIGETWTNSNDGTGRTCDGGVQSPPPSWASQTVAGFNAPGTIAGQNVAFAPFINLGLGCFSPDNQQINANNQGPYTPAKQ
jgi:hypothetical protein